MSLLYMLGVVLSAVEKKGKGKENGERNER
jgi:hypothetical protein